MDLFAAIAVIFFTIGCIYYLMMLFACRKTHAIPMEHFIGGIAAFICVVLGLIWICLAGC